MGGYNLTYLDENKTHDIDVLCGAFMMMRRSALDKSGLLDEDFFMYGITRSEVAVGYLLL